MSCEPQADASVIAFILALPALLFPVVMCVIGIPSYLFYRLFPVWWMVQAQGFESILFIILFWLIAIKLCVCFCERSL